jgi:hypothetical protein
VVDSANPLETMPIDIEIDKLTDSVEDRLSGNRFDTQVFQLLLADSKQVNKNDWLFDWRREIEDGQRQVFKLIIKNEPNTIQGLISVRDNKDHIFVHSIESASFNRGKDKLYVGVPGNLFAFACKLSVDRGYEGYVAFLSKTALIDHYRKTLGAVLIGGQQMILNESAAKALVDRFQTLKNYENCKRTRER